MKNALLIIVLIGISYRGAYSQSRPLWGLSTSGGTNDCGVLFKYEPNTDVYTKSYEFSGQGGCSPMGTLAQVNDSVYFGVSFRKGTAWSGTLFKYNAITSGYKDVFEFDYINGNGPRSGPIYAKDGYLYGTTMYGGSNNGVIYRFQPDSGKFVVLHKFGGTNDLQYPVGSLIQADNGLLYGLAYAEGNNRGGGIFQFDPVTRTYSKIHDLSYTEGVQPWGSLVQADDGFLYGLTSGGGVNGVGALFRFDANSNSYTKLFDFRYQDGTRPEGSLIQASDGLLYGMTRTGGINGDGALFSFDLFSNIYTKLFDFKHNETGLSADGTLIQAQDGMLYGMTGSGGAYNGGVLFRYDINTKSFEMIKAFSTSTGSFPYQRSLLEEKSLVPSVVNPMLCVGGQVVIPYTVTGHFNYGNTFTIQLSDATGSFANPLIIGSNASRNSGNIQITIPANVQPGNRYRIRMLSSNPAFVGGDNGNDLSIKDYSPVITSVISGSADICANSRATYQISGTNGADTYTWTLPTGWAGTSNTSSIDVVAGTVGGEVQVIANNVCGASNAVVKVITVKSAPTAPSFISGQASICSGNASTFSIAAVSDADAYAWTLPTDWTGTSATTSIDVVTGITGGEVQVVAKNTCGSSSAVQKVVEVKSAPTASPSISGNASICSGGLSTFTIGAISGADWYVWTLPSGWTGSSTTTAIDVVAGEAGGELQVTANNSCGSSSISKKEVLVIKIPNVPATINGSDQVCSGGSGKYSIDPVADADRYVWSLPLGWTGTSEQTEIETGIGLYGGTISISAINNCGQSRAQTKLVNVIVTPAKPTIERDGFTDDFIILKSSASAGNQWYKDGVDLPQATDQFLSVLSSGVYSVQVNQSGCFSDFSDAFPINLKDLQKDPCYGMSVLPNPVVDELVINGTECEILNYQLLDLAGRLVSIVLTKKNGSSSYYAQVQHLSQGTYILKLQTVNGLKEVKFIKI